VKTQLTQSRGKLLNSKVSGTWQAITELSNDSRGTNLLYFNNVLIDPPKQRPWYHIKMSNVLPPTGKIGFH